MSDVLTKYDAWLNDDGPAALVIREHLMPVEGRDGVVFPATFAAEQGNDPNRFRGGYNIDGPFNGQPDGENVCLIDSVGSQANRVEPEFAKEKYRTLVPQITIKAGNEKEVSILDAGHRAGDALLRCTELAQELKASFESVGKGDAQALARIAPTSLVFGVWDSRDTQAKLPRILGSTIRAFNVRKLTRGAVYIPPLDYSALEVFSKEDKETAEGDKKSPLAQRGFVHNPASGSHGGIIATGGIRRDATLNLAALRLLNAGKDDPAPLRRYILGLSLVAFTHPSAFVGYLRQGCTLVRDPDKKPEFVEVHPDGKRAPAGITHEAALTFAETAAKAFGVGESKSVTFDKNAAKQDVTEAGKKNKKTRKTEKAEA
ncbi:MAG: type I-U CRISPR-associated protein Cas7 [Phycisphaerales bacterium]|nr:type I-U CRISPR-associated protein Cas7 [Phycisphaerales bacterium]